MSKRAAAALVLSGLLAGCLDGPAAMVSTAALAPSPPGWFAFCTAHDGGAACDPIPRRIGDARWRAGRAAARLARLLPAARRGSGVPHVMTLKGLALLLLFPGAAAAEELDAARWAELGAVNAAVNALPARRDRERFGVAEYWEAADSAGGDCEDKALAARDLLLGRGWPPGALRLALAWTEAREYHAVLTVEVERGGSPATYVLDSRFPWVLAWDALTRHGYRWAMRQDGGGRWRRVPFTP